ncbi:M6 family metalloprotease domain-containing protein [Streptomyces sp. SID4948]|uniref:M6 family metalloprotease domain-containing protein n=1 Tax=Streptomyces sp. SID4948 TaxID=2690287 RepID=UPI000D19DE34|nr:M6 family metalloprotease domain-containing protein [Streptomyces sp. DvalAA-14]MYS24628.1 M6 family metalloprotease domain-containing protein [Streptomyces sp. SID4948]
MAGFAALVAWTLMTGPAAAAAGSACLLPRTRVHHSEGVDSWESDYAHPVGDVKALMIFLSFPDSEPRLTPAEVAADHFPATSEFFAQASYGKFRLHVHPQTRWLKMPHPSTDYLISRDWNARERSAYLRDALSTADPVVDFHGYDVVYLVADPDAPGVDSDATKVVNLASPVTVDGNPLHRLVTVFEHHPPDHNVLAHETGHVFDLPDLYYRPPAGSNADWDTHVGDWDLMGSQFGLSPDPFAWHKWKLGWLGDDQVGCVSRTGITYHDLSPDETPGGTKLLVVRTGEDTALAVEARSAAGNDRLTCRQGVLLYRVRSDRESGDGPIDVIDGHPGTSACAASSVYAPLADAPLGVGESYTVPDGSTQVTVTGRTSEGDWTVRVTESAPGSRAGPGREA